MQRAFIGNDVVDLRAVERAALIDAAKAARHLTAAELARAGGAGVTPDAFWAMFAAKEAAYKALAQAGIPTPYGGYTCLETDLAEGRVIHVPRAVEVEIVAMAMDEEKVHCVAVFPRLGVWGGGASFSWAVLARPEGADASEFARERLAGLIERCSGGGVRASRLAIVSDNGIPRVREAGELREWSVSLSHAGRFVAYAVCM